MTKETLSTLQIKIEELKKENKKLKAKLTSAQKSFLNIADNSLDAVIIINSKKHILYANYAAIQLFERNVADLLGKSLHFEFDPNQALQNKKNILHFPKSNGYEIIAQTTLFENEWHDENCFVISFRDITERSKNEEIVEYLSKHDYLTELPNRNYFEEQINIAIQYCKKIDTCMALLYLDIDNFKSINDNLGHNQGDILLKFISKRLKEHIRRGDTISRWGGDEFAIILTNLRKPEFAEKIAKNLLDKLSEPFLLNSEEIFIHASIGIALYPTNGTSPKSLIHNADKAMSFAKAHGKNQYRVFSKELTGQHELNLQITNGLRGLLRNQELFLHYQPIINLATMRCEAIEALVRWNHPTLGPILPDQFLPEAEAAGIITEVGLWVFNQALEDYKNLDGLEFLSINISANEFIAYKNVKLFLSILEKHGVDPKKLAIELTETTIMREALDTIKQFNYLAKLGLKIAIDDYGAGYSSLNALKQLHVSILKIDKSFIKNISTEPIDLILVKSTIELAHSLGLKVIAEGVENKKQYEILKMNQCDYVQGNYFSPAVAVDVLKKYLKQKKT